MSKFYYPTPHLNILGEGREARAKQREVEKEGERTREQSEMEMKKEQEKGQPHGYRSRPSQVEIDLCEPIQTPANLAFL